MTLNSHLWLTIVALAAYYGCIADGHKYEPLKDEPLKGYVNPGFEGEEAFEGEEDEPLKAFANPGKILTALKSLKSKALKYETLKGFEEDDEPLIGFEEDDNNLKATNLKATNLKATNMKATNLKDKALKYIALKYKSLKDNVRSEIARVEKVVEEGVKKQCAFVKDKGVIAKIRNMFFTPEDVEIVGNYIKEYFIETAQKLNGCTVSNVIMERTDADVLATYEDDTDKYINGVTLSYTITNDALNDSPYEA